MLAKDMSLFILGWGRRSYPAKTGTVNLVTSREREREPDVFGAVVRLKSSGVTVHNLPRHVNPLVLCLRLYMPSPFFLRRCHTHTLSFLLHWLLKCRQARRCAVDLKKESGDKSLKERRHGWK